MRKKALGSDIFNKYYKIDFLNRKHAIPDAQLDIPDDFEIVMVMPEDGLKDLYSGALDSDSEDSSSEGEDLNGHVDEDDPYADETPDEKRVRLAKQLLEKMRKEDGSGGQGGFYLWGALYSVVRNEKLLQWISWQCCESGLHKQGARRQTHPL